MLAKYIGKDGIMGLKKNKEYDVIIEKKAKSYVYDVYADGTLVQYSSESSIKKNWDIQLISEYSL